MVTHEQLLDAGVHFGHMARKWHPAMAPYIFMERNSIHIIDLNKTIKMLDQACQVTSGLARMGKKILFVGTKKQAKEILISHANSVNMPYVTERWLGGMLTNYQTVRKSIRRLQQIEKMEADGTYDLLQKKERLTLNREKSKLDKILRGVVDMKNLPAALFIVDIKKEHIALAEAKKLGIPTIAIVDTNSNPNFVDFPIPGNDDAARSINVIIATITGSIKEGLANRKVDREEAARKEDTAAPEIEIKDEE